MNKLKDNNDSLFGLMEMHWKTKILFVILIFANVFAIVQTLYASFILENIHPNSYYPLFIIPVVLIIAKVYLIKTKRADIVTIGITLVIFPIIIARSFDVGGLYGNIILWFYVFPLFNYFYAAIKGFVLSLFLSLISSLYIAYETSINLDQQLANALAFDIWSRYFFYLGPLVFMAFIIIQAHIEREAFKKAISEQQKQTLNQIKTSSLAEMSSHIAHEINNPLSILDAQAYRLNKRIPKDDEQAVTLVQDMRKTVVRMGKVIRNLRAMSQNHQLDEHKICSPAKLINDIHPYIEQKLKNIGFELIDESYGHKIKCQITLLEQALLNLIYNAIDALRKTEEALIKVHITEDKECITYHIIDNGPGIDEKIRSDIFLPYFTTKPMGIGSGIGLSLCKTIIELHHGEIDYQSTPNKGAHFIIRLPKHKES